MENFFASYAQAYVDQDFTQVAAHFAYPCMLTNQSGTDMICDDDDLEQHLTGFLSMLGENNLAEALVTIEQDNRHGSNNRVVSVNWTLINGAGHTFADLDFLYVLVGGEGHWKISVANLI